MVVVAEPVVVEPVVEEPPCTKLWEIKIFGGLGVILIKSSHLCSH